MAPAPEPKLAVACSEWEEKVPSATVVGLARWAPRTARCPLSLLPTCRSLSCSSCPGLPGDGHCQVVGLWRCLFPPSQANGCAICEIVATVLASKCACVGLLGCNRAMLAASREQCWTAQDRDRWRSKNAGDRSLIVREDDGSTVASGRSLAGARRTSLGTIYLPSWPHTVARAACLLRLI